MATKKSSKSSKSTVSKKAEDAPIVPPARLFRAPRSSIMPVRQYLMSVGTRPTRVEPMSAWAKGQGLSVATVSQWKTLFENY